MPVSIMPALVAQSSSSLPYPACRREVYDFIPIIPSIGIKSVFRPRPASFWQNEIPQKNSVESMDCAQQKVPLFLRDLSTLQGDLTERRAARRWVFMP